MVLKPCQIYGEFQCETFTPFIKFVQLLPLGKKKKLISDNFQFSLYSILLNKLGLDALGKYV